MCNRNRINCRELNEYKILVGCVDYDTWTCNKTASDECGELCSLVTIACEEDKNESIAPCDGGEGSGSGRCRVFGSDNHSLVSQAHILFKELQRHQWDYHMCSSEFPMLCP